MKLFIVTFVALVLCIAGLGIRIWIKGEFIETETGRNKNMKKLGINCVKNEEMEQHNSSCACSGCSFFSACSKKS
ncbi:MAG: hypothetical protein LBQ70_06550 [Prevotellaceae bacterium]|jgi:hypothetical protein|nr:hypothetical protein [Prevotellaceae bacterium]